MLVEEATEVVEVLSVANLDLEARLFVDVVEAAALPYPKELLADCLVSHLLKVPGIQPTHEFYVLVALELGFPAFFYKRVAPGCLLLSTSFPTHVTIVIFLFAHEASLLYILLLLGKDVLSKENVEKGVS